MSHADGANRSKFRVDGALAGLCGGFAVFVFGFLDSALDLFPEEDVQESVKLAS